MVHEHTAPRSVGHEPRGKVHDIAEDCVLATNMAPDDPAPTRACGHTCTTVDLFLAQRIAEAPRHKHRANGVVDKMVQRWQSEDREQQHALIIYKELVHAALQRVARALEQPHEQLRSLSVVDAGPRVEASYRQEYHCDLSHLGLGRIAIEHEAFLYRRRHIALEQRWIDVDIFRPGFIQREEAALGAFDGLERQSLLAAANEQGITLWRVWSRHIFILESVLNDAHLEAHLQQGSHGGAHHGLSRVGERLGDGDLLQGFAGSAVFPTVHDAADLHDVQETETDAYVEAEGGALHRRFAESIRLSLEFQAASARGDGSLGLGQVVVLAARGPSRANWPKYCQSIPAEFQDVTTVVRHDLDERAEKAVQAATDFLGTMRLLSQSFCQRCEPGSVGEHDDAVVACNYRVVTARYG
mmetsp:Transcript_101869/g.287401  ORF Transcript_101869/g.287401 Transcript_101869/m.287401 type:complete len:413 (+) Transcript_101869:1903-3141(+)